MHTQMKYPINSYDQLSPFNQELATQTMHSDLDGGGDIPMGDGPYDNLQIDILDNDEQNLLDNDPDKDEQPLQEDAEETDDEDMFDADIEDRAHPSPECLMSVINPNNVGSKFAFVVETMLRDFSNRSHCIFSRCVFKLES